MRDRPSDGRYSHPGGSDGQGCDEQEAEGAEGDPRTRARERAAAPKKPVVAIVRTTPETVLEDYARLLDLSGYRSVLDKNAQTILKNNISWHLLYPGANTTPWQIDGVVRKLKHDGYDDLVVVENQTVVTDALKGEHLNNFTPVHDRHHLPIKYNFNPADMRWVTYEPKGPMLVLDQIFPKGIRIPDFFFGRNVVHLPTIKTHIYTDYTCALKNAFGALLDKSRHYCHPRIHETLVDLLRIQQEVQAGTLAVADGTTAGSGPGPRTMTPDREERDPREHRSGGDRCRRGEAHRVRSDGREVHPARARGGARPRSDRRDRHRRRHGQRRGPAHELGLRRRRQRRVEGRRHLLVRAAEAAVEADVPDAHR